MNETKRLYSLILIDILHFLFFLFFFTDVCSFLIKYWFYDCFYIFMKFFFFIFFLVAFFLGCFVLSVSRATDEATATVVCKHNYTTQNLQLYIFTNEYNL